MIRIREAEASDLPDILAIYNEVVETSEVTFDLEPQTVEGRADWFAAFDERHPFLVAEENGKIAGYCYLAVFRGKPGYWRTAESTVYIHRDCRRQGLALRLLQELLAKARELGYHAIVAGIANDSEASTRLHKKLGFEKVGCFKELGRKFGVWLVVCFYQVILK
jgi:phosphinothricin acetyltransferase